MGLFDAPDNRSFLGVPFKALSDEEKAKKAAEAERKKKVETFMSFQEKLDDIARLQAEIQVAKVNAMQASPGVFATGIGSPGLNLGPEGLAGLAQRGGTDLATAQARLSKWLTGIDPLDLQNMSQERKLMVQQYMQLEQYLRSVMRDNQMLQQELAYTQSVAQRAHNGFDDDHYDDGSDPDWYNHRRRRRGGGGGHRGHHGGGGHPPYANHPHPHSHPQAHSHHPPHAHAYPYTHPAPTHAHPPAYTPYYPPAPAPCGDPYCSGNCDGTCRPPPPPPAHHPPPHHHHTYPAPGYGNNYHPATGYEPPLSPGFARARAAQNEFDMFNRRPGFY